MGVHGLWKLIEPAGKPIPLESLENKVLAVDVSIWLYQLTKGMQIGGGGTVPNAHLLGLFNRICKLLYYRIKPVFVFDGGVPLLKKETIEARKRQKRKAQDNSEELREKLLQNLLKQKAVNQLLEKEDLPSTSASIIDDMFSLPAMPEKESEDSDEDSDSEIGTAKIESFCTFQYGKDLHSIDICSEHFKSLPPDIRHEILSELVENRKQNSWARIHEMPEDSDDFSKYQMERLRKRRNVQVSLDNAAKEMGGRTMTFGELETLFREDGIVTDNLSGHRIASDNVTRYIYVKGKSKEDTEKETCERTQSEPKASCSQTVIPVSSEIEESKFHDEIQTIENSMFANDFSSDDEVQVRSESGNQFAHLLSTEETISQQEILAIIQRDRTKMLEKENNSCTSSEPKKNSGESVASSSRDHSVSQDTDDYTKTLGINELSFSNSENRNRLSDYKPSNSSSQELNLSWSENNESATTSQDNRSSLELFKDSNMDDGSGADTESSTAETWNAEKTVIGKENVQVNNQNDSDLDARSMELFADNSSSDGEFIEVTEETKESQYFKDFDKTVEISIDPSNIGKEDDIFSDIFANDGSTEMTSGDKLREGIENLPVLSHQKVSSPELFDNSNDMQTDDVYRNVLEGAKEDVHSTDGSSDISIVEPSGIVSTVSSIKSDEAGNALRSSNENARGASSEMPQNSEIKERQTDFVVPTQDTRRVPGSYRSTNITGEAVINRRKETFKTLSDIFDKVKKSEEQIKQNQNLLENSAPKKVEIPNDEELANIQKMLNDEEMELLSQRGKQERLGSTITQQMIIEAQELLQLFGLPYIVAPMEAEAQCAFLDQISLTEGTITDDSDIWLFGGQKVYKNFFDNKKYVLQFRSVDIEHFFKLSREQLIQMAMLVGSDYTVGVDGVGAVTALEILAYFSDKSNEAAGEESVAETLVKFRSWIKDSRSKSTTSLAKKLRNVSLNESFPSISVIKAYLHPSVDDSKDNFSWATPDLDRIRLYMRSKFGWSANRIDDILLPVMKRLMNKNKQTTLDNYFKAKPFSAIEFSSVSKRVIKAINVMKSKVSEDVLPVPSTSKSPAKSPFKSPAKSPFKSPAKSPGSAGKRSGSGSPATTPKKQRKNFQTDTVSPNSINKYFNSNLIPQKEKDKVEAAKRKLAAVKIYQAKKITTKGMKKRTVLPPKKDSSYLSESSDSDN